MPAQAEFQPLAEFLPAQQDELPAPEVAEVVVLEPVQPAFSQVPEQQQKEEGLPALVQEEGLVSVAAVGVVGAEVESAVREVCSCASHQARAYQHPDSHW